MLVLLYSVSDVASLISVAMISHSGQKQLAERKIYLVYTSNSLSIAEEVRAETQAGA